MALIARTAQACAEARGKRHAVPLSFLMLSSPGARGFRQLQA